MDETVRVGFWRKMIRVGHDNYNYKVLLATERTLSRRVAH